MTYSRWHVKHVIGMLISRPNLHMIMQMMDRQYQSIVGAQNYIYYA